MKKFTTSAQKTLTLPKADILIKLEEEMTRDADLTFEDTKVANIRQAKLADGSKVVIAAFDKDQGKTLAMIDFKDVPGDLERSAVQNKLRKILDDIF